jgi:Fur family transcriptional regulator, ferric uptake regulator
LRTNRNSAACECRTMTVSAITTGPVAQDAQAALGLMRSRGFRVTVARRLVLEALSAATKPLSAEELAAGAGGLVPESDLASVYRNLELLEELGLVRHVHLGHGPGLYELARTAPREYLICERCGEVQALSAAELDEVRAVVERSFGLEPRFTHFPLVGLCRRCRATPTPERSDDRAHS